MLTDGADHLLVNIGVHQADLWLARPTSDPASHLGKLLRIAIETGETETLAIGFRNSQGLARDAEGNLWATDQGPQGGDELNLVERAGNYGWPLVSYGVDYEDKVPLTIEDEAMGRHDGFLRPAFAWVPSPAVSASPSTTSGGFPCGKTTCWLLRCALARSSESAVTGRTCSTPRGSKSAGAFET